MYHLSTPATSINRAASPPWFVHSPRVICWARALRTARRALRIYAHARGRSPWGTFLPAQPWCGHDDRGAVGFFAEHGYLFWEVA